MDFDGYKKIKSLICACSGGVDSMVLAFLIKKFLPFVQAHFVIINHNLRECSTKEAEDTKKVLLSFGFKNVEILEWVHDKIDFAIEEKARKMRQKLIFEYAIKHSIDTIFLGHHFNDLEENFFLKLGMGAGLFGITSMKKQKKYRYNGYFFDIIRPLIFESKSDILALAKQNQIPFSEDESNTDDAFKRNRLRKKLTDFEVCKPQFLNSYQHLMRADELIKARLREIFKNRVIFNHDFGFFFSQYQEIDTLSATEIELCIKQIIFYFTEKCEVRRGELEKAILNIANKKGFTLGGMEVFFSKKEVFFIKEACKISNQVRDGVWDLRFKILEKSEIILPKLPFKVIKTLPFTHKDIEKGHFLSYKIKSVEFVIM